MEIDDFDPFDEAVIADPYPFYARLREEAPCHHVAGRDLYAVSRHHDVARVLRDHHTFSSSSGPAYLPVLADSVLIDQDPPTHTRHRDVLVGRFARRALRDWEPVVEDLARELLDPLVGAGPVDLVEDFAAPLPLRLIVRMVGLPERHLDDYRRWADAYFAIWALTEPSGMERLRPHLDEGLGFFADLVAAARRRGDATGLLAHLLHEQREQARLSDLEVVFFLYAFITAGAETTKALIANALLAAWEHHDAWRQVRHDPSLVPRFVEEVLRWDPPAQGVFRTAVEPATASGTTIPRGARVLALLGSVGRDADRYHEPDTFVLDRPYQTVLAFGTGIHACLGAALARMEAAVALRVLLARTRTVESAGPILRAIHPILRTAVEIPATLDGLTRN